MFNDVLALGGDQVFQCCGPVIVVCDSRRERCRRWFEGGRVRRVPVPARTRRWRAPLSGFGSSHTVIGNIGFASRDGLESPRCRMAPGAASVDGAGACSRLTRRHKHARVGESLEGFVGDLQNCISCMCVRSKVGYPKMFLVDALRKPCSRPPLRLSLRES